MCTFLRIIFFSFVQVFALNFVFVLCDHSRLHTAIVATTFWRCLVVIAIYAWHDFEINWLSFAGRGSWEEYPSVGYELGPFGYGGCRRNCEIWNDTRGMFIYLLGWELYIMMWGSQGAFTVCGYNSPAFSYANSKASQTQENKILRS